MASFCTRFTKAAQRSLLSALTGTSSALRCAAAIGAGALCLLLLASIWILVHPGLELSGHLEDNIGGRSFVDVVGGGPIDAVITWVNGSDPAWLKLKAATKRLIDGLPLVCEPSPNNTHGDCVSSGAPSCYAQHHVTPWLVSQRAPLVPSGHRGRGWCEPVPRQRRTPVQLSLTREVRPVDSPHSPCHERAGTQLAQRRAPARADRDARRHLP